MTGDLNTTNSSKSIDLSEYRIMDIKTIYNQPNKIFLLEGNLIMMYSYREKSQDKVEFMDDGAKGVYDVYNRRI